MCVWISWGIRSYSAMAQSIKSERLAWVITAPLGKPVEPEVNIMYAGSDGLTGSGKSKGPGSRSSQKSSLSYVSGQTMVFSCQLSRFKSAPEKINDGGHCSKIFSIRLAGFLG